MASEVRHSGASIEIGLGLRSLAEGQKQWRWANAVSLKRYVKCGELDRQWQSYLDIQQRHFVAREIGLSAALLEGKFLPDVGNQSVVR